MSCDACRKLQQDLTDARIDLGELLTAARHALYQLGNAVEAGGGDPTTHRGCVELSEAIAVAANALNRARQT